VACLVLLRLLRVVNIIPFLIVQFFFFLNRFMWMCVKLGRISNL